MPDRYCIDQRWEQNIFYKGERIISASGGLELRTISASGGLELRTISASNRLILRIISVSSGLRML